MRIERILVKAGRLIQAGEEINSSNLRRIGIKSYDIAKAVEDGYMIQNPDGSYEIGKIGPLFEEVDKFWKNNDYANAKFYLESLIELRPDHVYSHLKLLYIYIIHHQLEKAVPQLEFLYTNCTPGNEKYLNIFWVLLSRLIKLPEEFELLAASLTFDDLKIETSKEIPSISKDNLIRYHIFEKDYKQAMICIKSHRKLRTNRTVFDEMQYALLKKCIANQKEPKVGEPIGL